MIRKHGQKFSSLLKWSSAMRFHMFRISRGLNGARKKTPATCITRVYEICKRKARNIQGSWCSFSASAFLKSENDCSQQFICCKVSYFHNKDVWLPRILTYCRVYEGYNLWVKIETYARTTRRRILNKNRVSYESGSTIRNFWYSLRKLRIDRWNCIVLIRTSVCRKNYWVL